ncbi:type I-U CRISPR-associated protein Csx17 [Candidatus Poribacteria bacterium]|nr:type I-U CRISPR-associated protein Csx17 [Gammaproteobacteria bacterium]MYF99458.1 type I-U CRISPR-associated protein Csx17 [Candidatus Poribacteria bacterium]
MAESHEIALTGCTPTPLAGYLKGLGILRILSNFDPAIKAAWVGENLVLTSNKPAEVLLRYLLDDYAPTPVLAPWNGGSGFYQNDNRTSLERIKESNIARLSAFRISLDIAERALDLEGLQRESSPKNEAKTKLLNRLRGLLPDDALEWFDASILLAGEKEKFPPLLGTGGNDGRLDFTNNFMQRLLELIDAESGKATPRSADLLDLALFAKPAPGLAKQAIGQFAPGQVGGPNSTTGYEIKGTINPWDFVLMIEGALPFAAAAVRRNEQSGAGILSYPFTVRAVSAGSGNLGAGDAVSSRGELWMPLWSNPANYTEIRALLSEGRVALGVRPARDALDFVRAVHRLGGYRGVDRFQRYGLLMRSGKAYLATPLERVQVTTNPQSGWIDELERNDWLTGFRLFSKEEITANRFAELRHRLENTMFVMAQRKPSPGQTQSLLILLGEIQGALSRSVKAHETISPVPQLSAKWVQEANDEGPEFRIARALAGLRGVGGQALPLRSQLFPIHHANGNEWLMKACKSEKHKKDPACLVRTQVSVQQGLVSTLIDLLRLRLSLPARLDFADKPLNSWAGVGLVDLMDFLYSDRMDARIAALLPGLALCEIPADNDHKPGGGAVSAAFALCKLALSPDTALQSLRGLPETVHIPAELRILAKLASGEPTQAEQAVKVAWRRLRSSGLEPVMPFNQLPNLAGVDPRRLAAALLIPLGFGATHALAEAVLSEKETVQPETP